MWDSAMCGSLYVCGIPLCNHSVGSTFEIPLGLLYDIPLYMGSLYLCRIPLCGIVCVYVGEGTDRFIMIDTDNDN